MVAYAVGHGRDGRPSHAYGFVGDPGPFGEAVFGPLARDRIPTPQFAARAVAYDSLISISVLAPDGRAIYDVNPRRPELRMTMVPRVGHETYAVGPAPLTLVTLFADTVHLGPQYGGLILDVALATRTPGDLVAGALPASRLVVLLGLLVLMAGLVAVAVLQLRREHELVRLRADFTTGVSHELRTPLAQILLYGETLMLERTRSERERRSAAEVIVREARRLMHLVENALHFARADRALIRLAPRPLALAPLTREILIGFAPLAWAGRITLRERLSDECHALIDPAAYRQILLNLLDNAVKYGPSGQTVTVCLAPADNGQSVRLTVDDEGPGVPPAERERIWAPFVRLDGSAAGRAGAGIGLAVVRDLVTRHGGRAWAEATAAGARFVVELPATDAPKDAGHDDAGAVSRAAL
jgi:signal transduction histidine kinase